MTDPNTPVPETVKNRESKSGEATQDAIIAFCQQCGRPLTVTARRQIGSAIVCEPCALTYRTQTATAQDGWVPVTPSNSFQAEPSKTTGSLPRKRGEPSPALGAWLGLIPGVGAMYNGQYPKAAIHLGVFVVLVSLADNLNWVFWWFVWGWIFYQAFDSYHTAQAKRDGTPLPDPFGWNGLGERFANGRRWPTTAPSSAASPSATAEPGVGFGADTGSSSPASATATYGVPAHGEQPFAAIVPPAQDATYAYAATSASEYAKRTRASMPPGGEGPYAPTYTGAADAQGSMAIGADRVHRFPSGAVWLIGLGSLFLLGNLWPSWHLESRWLAPLLLACAALWTGVRRLQSMSSTVNSAQTVPSLSTPARVAAAVLGPCLLFTLAVLIALQVGLSVPLRHSWPALLIVWGVLLLVERSSPFPNSEVSSTATPPQSPR